MNANQIIVCKSVGDSSDSVLNQVEKTYNDSFPESERRAFILVRELIKNNPAFKVYAVFRNDVYVGFITAWSFADFMYIEHFAIDESARNGGIGAKVLSQFLNGCQLPVVLEVELPVEEMSKRRIGFYERLGFTLDNHVYFQPPYRSGEPSIEMRLMSYGNINLTNSFEAVRNNIHKYVYDK
ncbi:GNAT family N-acetyltransferase [Parabacteroides bouchesdurhonensis]|uniref:GNAT family N-acetyltransferase n=1 Tax=Parabacteroides bouchesdurhonensis TaxID=1936995 RepID=UPI000C859255|nr:GNAT family N-acetyltransferase [Parabacteroides bouchesdurhonensis]